MSHPHCLLKAWIVLGLFCLSTVVLFLSFGVSVLKMSPPPLDFNTGVVIRTPEYSELCDNHHIDKELRKIRSNIPFYSFSKLPRLLNKKQRASNMQCLNAAKRLFCDLNATWSLYFGSLLGAYIAHDVLPWDDDIDIIVEDRVMSDVVEMNANGTLQSVYNLGYSWINGLHKLYWKSARRIEPYPWTWPFLDVIPFVEEDGRVHVRDREREHNMKLSSSSIFPLQLRPFGGSWLPSPRDPWTVLAFTYFGVSRIKCRESWYDHVHESSRLREREVSCSTLAGIYPFAYRQRVYGQTLDILKMGERPLYSWITDSPYHEDAQPFTWQLRPKKPHKEKHE